MKIFNFDSKINSKRHLKAIARSIFVATIIIFFPRPGLLASESWVTFCFNDWPPFVTNTNAGPEGISIAIIKESARRIGLQVRFEELPWNRCLQKVKDGEIDAVIDAAERTEFIQGPASFSLFSDTFWVREQGGAVNYSDISGGKVGLVDGYNYGSSLLDYLDVLNLQQEMAVDDPTNIRKLAFGRVNVIIADLASTLHFSRRHGLSIRPILPPFSYDRLYASFSQDKVEIQHQFDQIFTELLNDGFIDTVYQQHLGTSYSEILNKN